MLLFIKRRQHINSLLRGVNKGYQHQVYTSLRQLAGFVSLLGGQGYTPRVVIVSQRAQQYPVDFTVHNILITNRVHWEITRILRVYGKRWTGMDTFHRDGKQHLGMGDCQLRKGEAQTRHLYLVMLAHSLLMAQMKQGRASEWAQTRLATIGEACRAALRETCEKPLPGPLNGLPWRAGVMSGSRHTSPSYEFAKVQF